MVAHQLKTPLSIVKMAAETVQLGRVSEPAQIGQYVTVIRAEAGRLLDLVDQSLELLRTDSERSKPLRERVNLDAMVATAIARLQARTGDRPILFESDGVARWILAEPVALEQALMNLLDNAAKYSPPERPIVVRLETRGRHFAVTVIDEGMGIPNADLPHVGERFFRGSNNGSTRTGFGLGLAIVRQIVENHRGRIEVSSVAHQGTTVRLELPRIKET
jgi:two-component system phosphate regulon sensor histidine kinase PhoR